MEGGGGTEERVLRRREGAGVTEVVRNKDTRRKLHEKGAWKYMVLRHFLAYMRTQR